MIGMSAEDDLDQTETYEPDEGDVDQYIELPPDNGHPVTTGSDTTQSQYHTMPSGMSSSFWSQATPSQDGQRFTDSSSRFDMFASQYFNTPNGGQLPPSGAPPPYSERGRHAPVSPGNAQGEHSAPSSLSDAINGTSTPGTLGDTDHVRTAQVPSTGEQGGYNPPGSLGRVKEENVAPGSLGHAPRQGSRVNGENIGRHLSAAQERNTHAEESRGTFYSKTPARDAPPIANIFQEARDMSPDTRDQMVHLARILVCPRTQEESDRINETVDELRALALNTVPREEEVKQPGARPKRSPINQEMRPGGLQTQSRGLERTRDAPERSQYDGTGHSPHLAGGPQYQHAYLLDQHGASPVIPGQASAHSTPVLAGYTTNPIARDPVVDAARHRRVTISQPRYETRSHTAAARLTATEQAGRGQTDAPYFTAPPPGGPPQAATTLAGRGISTTPYYLLPPPGGQQNGYQGDYGYADGQQNTAPPRMGMYPSQPQTIMTPAVASLQPPVRNAIVAQQPSRVPFTRREGSAYVTAPITLDLNQTSAHVAALYQDRDLLPPPGVASGQGIRIGDFDENKESWKIWSHKFKLMAMYNTWNDTQAKIQLATRLSGPIVEAQSALIRRSDTTLQDVLTKIDAWFCTPGDNMNKEGKFLHMSRNAGEALVRFGLRIDTEAGRAFPGSDDAVLNSLKVNVLLQGCSESTRTEIFKMPVKEFKAVLQIAQLQEDAAVYSGSYPAWDARTTTGVRQTTDLSDDSDTVAWTRDNRRTSSTGSAWAPRMSDKSRKNDMDRDKSRNYSHHSPDGRRSETPSPDRKESRETTNERGRETDRRRDYDREYSGRSRERRRSGDYRRDDNKPNYRDDNKSNYRSDNKAYYRDDRERSRQTSPRGTDKSVSRSSDKTSRKDTEDGRPKKREGDYLKARENDRRNDRSSSRGYKAREIQDAEDGGDSVHSASKGLDKSN